MTPFEYQRVNQPEAAVEAISRVDHAKFLAGGTNLVDLMKSNVEHPTRLVDITRLSLSNIEELPDGGVRLGALARNTDTADHPLVRQKYPLLSEAILAGASPQLRNMATNGGNLMQRTRCYYFMDVAFPQCNKRVPGSGCGAIDGFNRIHAILGTSDQCIATHPSDMCVALAALDAKVHVAGPMGAHFIAMVDFHRLPENTPQRDTNLNANEIVTALELPAQGFTKNYTYLKIRDRLSYAFALVSVAVGLEMDGNTIRQARFALGGVAHKPWRDTTAEAALNGQAANQDIFTRAAELLLRDARGYEHNAFKIDLARRTIVRALTQAAQGTPQSQSNKKIA